MGMREILAYAPIEPDGSVKIEVPANVPFTIEILDKNARRISVPHTSWLQLVPGETKKCTGCHNPTNPANATYPVSHGRSGLTTSVYAGAAVAGAVFIDTVATLPAVNAGDTMAETRVANTCLSGSTTPCSQVPSIDVLYADVWTDPAARMPDVAFSYLYSALSTPKPSNSHCVTWDALCRSTIHYPDSTTPPYEIQSLWDFPRASIMVGGVAVDPTCVSCHNPMSTVAPPAGQLDLTGSASTQDMTVTTSYEELLFQHNAQIITMGALVDEMVGGQPVPVVPFMTAGSALNSQNRFLYRFDPLYADPNAGNMGEQDHRGFLTPAELRLISEWLDIGAQYYNDPFVAPVAN